VTAHPTPGRARGSADGGREVTFALEGRQFTFKTPRPGDPSIPSAFLVGLPKAGSTLLNRLMRPIITAAGLSFVALQEILFDMGVAAQAIPREVNVAFEPCGYVFGGFRSLPGGFSIPSFASDRTIVLVRDPRDMLTSLYFSLARSHRPPGNAVGEGLAATFSQQREEVNRMSIDAFALERAGIVANQFRIVTNKLSMISHRLYRYEDVVFDKLSWTRDMIDYLGLTVSAAVIEKAVAANDVRPEVEDPAQHVRKVVPGDHREKLKPEIVEKLNRAFKPILLKYGYL
jgi:hypothetical protein